MGKAIRIIGGVIAVAIGVFLLIRWINVVVMGIQFCVVGALVLGGLMAVVFGIIEIKDAIELKKMEKEEKEEKEGKKE